jgi:hypothetical protein
MPVYSSKIRPGKDKFRTNLGDASSEGKLIGINCVI